MSLRQILFTGAVLLAVAGALAVEERRLALERTNAITLRLQAANARAERDTTREVAIVNGTLAASLGDSLRLFERSVRQVPQQPDALDAAIGAERTANYRLAATIDSLTAAATRPSVLDRASHTRRAHFYISQPPYAVDADVEQSERPDSLVTLALQVRLDTLPLTIRLTCGPADSLGVRSASVVTIAPQWASLRLDHLEQDPAICAARSLETPPLRHRLRLVPVLAAGRVLGAGGGWTFVAGIGVTF